MLSQKEFHCELTHPHQQNLLYLIVPWTSLIIRTNKEDSSKYLPKPLYYPLFLYISTYNDIVLAFVYQKCHFLNCMAYFTLIQNNQYILIWPFLSAVLLLKTYFFRKVEYFLNEKYNIIKCQKKHYPERDYSTKIIILVYILKYGFHYIQR